MAKEWGVGKERDGYANQYEIECEGLTVLNLEEARYNILHWLSVLLQNREFDVLSSLAREAKEYLLANFLPDYGQYDVIIGYRADDSYFSFAQDFINGTISYRQLKQAMHLGKLGRQFVIKGEKAFDRIRFIGYETAFYRDWYVKRRQRDQKARRDYFDMDKDRWQKGDIYITQILEEEMKADDVRLR